MAGACVVIALREYVPDYLQRLGMELELAHRLGVKMRFFNLIVLIVGVWFGANIARMQWAYVTSVLTLLAGASLAALLSIRHENRWLWLKLPLALFATTYFLGMSIFCAGISLSGLEIALAFAVGIIFISALSRWFRSTELRWQGYDFQDDESRTGWERCCRYDFQILVPHRPGAHSRSEKVRTVRKRHRLGPEIPIIVIEVELGDPSDFFQRPLMRVIREDGIDIIQVSRSASISHVLAAIALEMSRVGRPVEVHCGWSNESPIAANLNFLLFGEGNIPWMMRELIRKAEPDPSRHPLVMLG
jgi:prepilin signal peptidase PulO-like enzyme (type II secretory pathway)